MTLFISKFMEKIGNYYFIKQNNKEYQAKYL